MVHPIALAIRRNRGVVAPATRSQNVGVLINHAMERIGKEAFVREFKPA